MFTSKLDFEKNAYDDMSLRKNHFSNERYSFTILSSKTTMRAMIVNI